jgi:ATP-dependent RNA helicase DDX35
MTAGLLKKVQRRRPDLRLVISSATLEVARLAAFFDTSSGAGSKGSGGSGLPSRAPAVLSVEGRTHPVQVGGSAR